MATTNTAMTTGWSLVSTGPKAVTLTLAGAPSGEWAVTDTADAPVVTHGHSIRQAENLTLDLSIGERLWLRGRGVAVVTEEGGA